MNPVKLFYTLYRKYRRYHHRRFVRNFGKMLGKFAESMEQSDFNRHEIRRIKRDMLKNMHTYADILGKW